MKWKSNGQQCNLRVKAVDLGDNEARAKEAAGQVAMFMKGMIERAFNKSNVEHFEKVKALSLIHI